MKLHLGCGSQVFDGWINVDYALGAWLARVPLFPQFNRKFKIFNLDWDSRIHLHNLTRRFPWQDESAEVVYSAHTLEHFSREHGRHFLTESHRVLKKGGIIRIIVPDLQYIARQYVDGQLPADQFLHALGVLYGSYGNNRLKNRLSYLLEFPHKCMYDTSTLQRILEEIGFQAASRGPFESDIHDIRQVELEGRTRHAVIVEGRKRPS
jgi:Methyltransferase domain